MHRNVRFALHHSSYLLNYLAVKLFLVILESFHHQLQLLGLFFINNSHEEFIGVGRETARKGLGRLIGKVVNLHLLHIPHVLIIVANVH